MRVKLAYDYDETLVELTETPKERDVEFEIRLHDDEAWERLKEIQRFFEANEVYTDALFYPFANRRMRAIVRRDYYEDFILSLMKHRLLTRVEWTSPPADAR